MIMVEIQFHLVCLQSCFSPSNFGKLPLVVPWKLLENGIGYY